MSKSGKNGSTGNNGSAVVKRGRVENLKSWKPVQSGNPSGRPVRKPLTRALEKYLAKPVPGDKKHRTFLEKLIEETVARALKRSDVLVKEIFERMDGKIAPDEAQANLGVQVILMDKIPRPDRTGLLSPNGVTTIEGIYSPLTYISY